MVKKSTQKMIDNYSSWLAVIGASNWGFVQWFNFDIVGKLSGWTAPIVGTVLYSLVGASGLYLLFRKIMKK